MDVISDRDFAADSYANRNVILYGNADTNVAWNALLKDCPVQVTKKNIQVGGKKFTGTDLACYFIWPRPDSQYASVGVVSGTGLTGLRAATENRYFVSGTGFPDLLIFSAEMYNTGAEGIQATGFFGNDWSVEKGDFAWGD